MRVNIYGEEITEEIELITKEEGGRVFFGVRFYLKSHEDLHDRPDDDDRSAVTFWVPWTHDQGHDFDTMKEIFSIAAFAVRKAERVVDEARQNARALETKMIMRHAIEQDRKLRTKGKSPRRHDYDAAAEAPAEQLKTSGVAVQD